MKILMICDFYSEEQLYQDYMIAKNYIKLGHDVVVITSLYDNIFDLLNNKKIAGKPKIINSAIGVKVYKLPYQFNIVNKIKKFPRIFNILRTEAPDLIYSHGLNHNLNDVKRYKKVNSHVKHIMDFHADYTNSAKNWVSLKLLNGFIRRRYLKFYSETIDKYYAITPHVKKFISEVYGISRSSIDILPLGYDRDDAEKALENRAVYRTNANINSEEFIIISGGKFNRLKKTELLIDAVKIINNPKIKLLIFGKSEADNDAYEQELRQMSKGYNVEFLGWLNIETTLQLMACADLAVYPASQSVLWQQSIGMELPLIVGDQGGQDVSYLNLNSNIIILKDRELNAEYIANIINNLYTNRDRLLKMKNGAAKTAREFLDYEIIAQKTLNVINSISK